MTVSRAVFDAALTRVRDERECEYPCAGQYATASLCDCIASTLAALGLDEPPPSSPGGIASERQASQPNRSSFGPDAPPGGACLDEPPAEDEGCDLTISISCATAPTEDQMIAAHLAAVDALPKGTTTVSSASLNVPPSETPKACKGCLGKGTAQPPCPACGTSTGTHWYDHCPSMPPRQACPMCNGSGIDGGTTGLDLDPDPNEGRRLADDLPGSY